MINKQIEKPLKPPHQETIVGFNTIQTKLFDSQKINNMPQQTPVQWLIRNVNENIPPKYIPKEIVEIAKQLEKNFAAEMFLAGKNSEADNKKTFEQYYNEVYEQ